MNKETLQEAANNIMNYKIKFSKAGYPIIIHETDGNIVAKRLFDLYNEGIQRGLIDDRPFCTKEQIIEQYEMLGIPKDQQNIPLSLHDSLDILIKHFNVEQHIDIKKIKWLEYDCS